ncbi:PepSY domain-containing protein [Prevotella jejuni]|uniref:PepSY domain-containing protein n=1 Tax=Prevotella jejuni TaxID=1177574 RepID=UPI003C757399
MKKSTWRQHHKWLGIVLAPFIILFCFSGIVLNHAGLLADVNISRKLLPAEYRYDRWNKGLLRGTMKWNCKTLIYGNSGIWLKEESNGTIRDFNRGLPNGADHRSIRGVVSMPNGFLYAISQYNLYCLNECGAWMRIDLPNDEHERLSDITQKNDSLIITGRSHIYLSHVPYHTFQKITLKKGGNDKGKVSLFRTTWLLHGGGLFGIVGKLFVDFVGLILLFLSISGIYYSFAPRPHSSFGARIKSWLIKWHNQIGWASIFFLLLLTITGWMLRPPALIAIASAKIPPIPFSAMDSDNPWNDCLRSLRYDDDKEDWLLCTSDGFYSLRHLSDTPQKEQVQPPVSVMGINVEQKDSRHKWLIGSFSGLYVWDRPHEEVTDYFTHHAPQPTSEMPISSHPISGFSSDIEDAELVVDYNKGCPRLSMPNIMATLPMSLRNVCIEVHTGRIFTFLGKTSILYIFLMGIACVWCLWSGWKIHRRNPKIFNLN